MYCLLVRVIGYSKNSPLDELFLDKSWLFLRILDSRWANAEEETRRIIKLLEKLGVERGSKILDLGCGNGRIAVHLAKHGYRVVGVDYSKVFIEDAKKKAEEHGVSDNIEFIIGDARRIDELFNENIFDATIMYWTTIIGYYLDPEVDRMILEKIWHVTRKGGYLLILNHASQELISCRTGYCGQASYYLDIDGELAMIEKPVYDPIRSVVKTTWVFYRKKGKNLEYIDEASFELRLYTLHEIIELAEKAGWTYVEAYGSLETLKPYIPGRSGLNIVFRKQ